MRSFKVVSATVIALIFSLSANAQTGTADADLIRDIDATWSNNLASLNLDGVMDVYSDDAVLLAPNQPIVVGKAAIREWFVAVMSTPGYSATFAPTKIVVARTGDIAYEIGTFSASARDSNGLAVSRVGKHLVAW